MHICQNNTVFFDVESESEIHFSRLPVVFEL